MRIRVGINGMGRVGPPARKERPWFEDDRIS